MSYKSDLLERLKDPAYCAGYLSAAMEDSSEAFLIALRDVAEVHAGLTHLAAAADVNRENLYRMLSQHGNPRLSSLNAVMAALGFRIRIEPIPKPVRRKRPRPQPSRALS